MTTLQASAAPEGTARWIAPDQPLPLACPVLRSTFEVRGKPSSATVRVVGLGHFELTLNGQRVGSSLVNQAWSQYDATIYSQEFDVTGLLNPGRNTWGVLLGNSFWWVGPANDTMRFVKTDAMPDFSGGNHHLLWLEARIRNADGSEEVVASDGSWRWREGPLRFSHIYAGEDYDAREASLAGPEDGDRTWRPVREVPPPLAKIEHYPAPPLRAFEVFPPDTIFSPGGGEYTYVFPQNCSALLRFTVEGPRGATIRMKPCEYVDANGRVRFTYTWGTNKDIWHDYTLKGSGPETHQTLFCYVGCQYVGVTGAVPAGEPNPHGLPVIRSLELVHVRAACPEAGAFICSSALQNGAYRMIDWSIRSNMTYLATDCPHREKNGWQEQNWHMARAFSYRFDAGTFFRKIARDVRDTQLPDGHIPTNCPNYLVGLPPHGYWNEAPEWGISGVLLPWHLYEWYGDREALEAAFASMTRYVDYLTSQAKEGIINSNLGDWYDYGHGKGDGPSQWTPTEVTATATWALGAKTVADAAAVLGRPGDERRYRELYGKIRQSFQDRFYNRLTKTVANNGSCQAGHSFALYAQIIPPEDREAVLAGIIEDLKTREYQQTVGEVSQVLFVRVLAEAGRNDVLHRVYSRESRGSYGYMVRQGFTTLPESWDARPGTPNSMNHFMLGHLMEWQFAYVGGIRQAPGGVGWKKVVIAPNPGPLTSAATSFNSPAGRIETSWAKEGERYVMAVRLAEGIEAEALLPDGSRRPLGPGQSTLHWK